MACWVPHLTKSRCNNDCTAAGSIFGLDLPHFLSPQPLMCFLDFPVLLLQSRQQENHPMGAGERNSWKLNAVVPHEFLRALSSHCGANVQDRNINSSADVQRGVYLQQQQQGSKTERHHLSASLRTAPTDTSGHKHTRSTRPVSHS